MMQGIILVNKEIGYTSRDIVNIACRVLGTKKIGHTGVLDKEAEGLVVLCVNKATKIIQFLETVDKKYQAVLELGKTTTTYDRVGEVVETKVVENISEVDVIDCLPKLLGDIKQYPPIYSNVKIDGKRLYQYALANEDVKIKSRDVTIFDLQVTKIDSPFIHFDVHCSKGTYVRSLCYDLAKDMGYPGYMYSLKRTSVGTFDLEQANSIEELKNGEVKWYTIEQALSHFPKITVDNEEDVKNGKKIKGEVAGLALIYGKEELLAIYHGDGKEMKCVRGLWS